jgi:hypothetical protein
MTTKQLFIKSRLAFFEWQLPMRKDWDDHKNKMIETIERIKQQK